MFYKALFVICFFSFSAMAESVENKDFSCLRKQFEEEGIQLVGVSKDSIDSHKNFVEKQELDVDLISDPELGFHKKLGAF